MLKFLSLFLVLATPAFSEEKAVKEVEVPRYDPLNDPRLFLEEERQIKPKEPETSYFLPAIGNLLLVGGALIALLYGAAQVMKRLREKQYEGQNRTSDIVILERRDLSPKAALYLVEVKGEKFLIGETPEALVKIDKLRPL